MKEITIKLKKRVLEIAEVNFAEKDIITLDKWEDFQEIAYDFNSVFLLKNTYYLISNDAIYVYQK